MISRVVSFCPRTMCVGLLPTKKWNIVPTLAGNENQASISHISRRQCCPKPQNILLLGSYHLLGVVLYVLKPKIITATHFSVLLGSTTDIIITTTLFGAECKYGPIFIRILAWLLARPPVLKVLYCKIPCYLDFFWVPRKLECFL